MLFDFLLLDDEDEDEEDLDAMLRVGILSSVVSSSVSEISSSLAVAASFLCLLCLEEIVEEAVDLDACLLDTYTSIASSSVVTFS